MPVNDKSTEEQEQWAKVALLFMFGVLFAPFFVWPATELLLRVAEPLADAYLGILLPLTVGVLVALRAPRWRGLSVGIVAGSLLTAVVYAVFWQGG
jgi:hypothetical protein